MPTPITFVITAAGVAAATAADGMGLDLELTHVALGAGGYTPTGAETALADRREKAIVSAGAVPAPGQISVGASFSAYAGAEYSMREIGLYAGDPDSGGTLFAVASVSSPDRLAVRNAAIAYTANFGLTLSGVPAGSVTVVVDSEGGVSAALVDAAMAAHIAASNPHTQYVRKVGDTMTGPLVLPGNAAAALQAVPKQQLDAQQVYGTFTPEVAFGGASVGIAYASQSGRFQKMGRMLFVTAYVVLTAKGSSTGNATVVLTGLPHLPDGTYLVDISADGLSGLTGVVSGIAVNDTLTVQLRQSSAIGSPANLTDAEFTNTTLLHLTAVLFTDP